MNLTPVARHPSLVTGHSSGCFVNTGMRRGKFNMEFDEHLARRLVKGSGSPTVRVYGWKPYALSLGYHQSDQDIDIVRCQADGIDVVRRPTGGRAIFHAQELTYSVVIHSKGKSVAQVYALIGEALLRALEHLGVEAEMSNASLNFSELYSDPLRRTSVSCFANTSRSEIQYKGKKLIGSAQRRYGDVVLQHGSLLLGPEHRRLAEYISDSRARAILETVLEEKTIEVESILQRPVSFDEAAEAVRRGFESAWGIGFTISEIGNVLQPIGT
jgi:lipoate-protein ligase A